MKPQLLQETEWTREFFLRSLRAFTEADSNYSPQPELFTVAAQVKHVAQTVEWFIGGLQTSFDMNFEEHDRQARACTSLAEAIAEFNRNIDAFKAAILAATDEHLNSPFPPGPLQGPRSGAVFGLVDHTAHHRGALAMYARAMGRVPVMPYMDL